MNLVPHPVSVTQSSGFFSLDRAPVRIDEASTSVPCFDHKLKTLGLKAKRGELEPCTVQIGSPRLAGLRVPRKDEGYALRCDRKGIVVRGNDLDGLFWGLTTLEQLIQEDRRVPCAEIRDYPAFEFRAHHDDISRKQVSKIADFKRIIRLLSSFKINYYTPYMEDMLYLKSFPDIGETRGHLTPDEVAALLSEAERYNVTVFPTFTLMGHQENLLSNPKYTHLGIDVFQTPSTYDPANPKLRPFLKKVIRDVCELFPDSPYFHAGFDETMGLSEELLVQHANWCAEEIGRHGKKMLMWVDMFKNHWGIDKIHRLHENIIPVEWNYGDPRQYLDEYLETGLSPMGLAGYLNWCRYLPRFSEGKRNIARWARVMKSLKGIGYGSSMWGDDGYENSRDLCWNLFAYNGEVTWRGRRGPADFERRFQACFYGTEIPALRNIVEKHAESRALNPSAYWSHFRLPLPGMVRMAARDPNLVRKFERDLQSSKQALAKLPAAKEKALREADHIDHFEVAIAREINVAERFRLARRIAGGLSGSSLESAVQLLVSDTQVLKRRYRQVWMRHNKRPNIEVSLDVYDRMIQSLKDIAAPEPKPSDRYLEVDLESAAPKNMTYMERVAGSPIGRFAVHGVPFRFPGVQHSHCVLKPGDHLDISFEPSSVKDIHLLYGGQTLHHKKVSGLLKVLLFNGSKSTFSETLRNVAEICNWFAPLGDHIWAGGGLRHADQKRNQYAFSPGTHHGVLHFSGFKLGKGKKADTLSLQVVGKEEIALFALTIEKE